MKSGRPGAHEPDKLGFSCKVNECSDAGTGDLGVLPTHETGYITKNASGYGSLGPPSLECLRPLGTPVCYLLMDHQQ